MSHGGWSLEVYAIYSLRLSTVNFNNNIMPLREKEIFGKSLRLKNSQRISWHSTFFMRGYFGLFGGQNLQPVMRTSYDGSSREAYYMWPSIAVCWDSPRVRYLYICICQLPLLVFWCSRIYDRDTDIIGIYFYKSCCWLTGI